MAAPGFLLLGSLACASVARADFGISFSLPQVGVTTSFVNGVGGYDFTPTRDLFVTALGFYDQGADGLLSSHPVGLYQTSTQALLATATVTSTSALMGSSNYRFAPVAPVRLFSGVRYTVLSFNGTPFDPEVRAPTGGVVFGDGFTYNRLRQGLTSGLQFPTQSDEDAALQIMYLGTNFQYQIAAVVPEPTSVVLVGAGAVCLAGYERRRRRSTRA